MENLKVIKATKDDTLALISLIKGLATYEKRPEDMTATETEINYWMFERNIATGLLLYKNNEPIGYAIYYPIFGSFSGKGKAYLEDMFIKKEFRGQGNGKFFFKEIIKHIFNENYSDMEWSCLDWNTPAMGFYHNIGAEKETGRVHFEITKENMEKLINK